MMTRRNAVNMLQTSPRLPGPAWNHVLHLMVPAGTSAVPSIVQGPCGTSINISGGHAYGCLGGLRSLLCSKACGQQFFTCRNDVVENGKMNKLFLRGQLHMILPISVLYICIILSISPKWTDDNSGEDGRGASREGC